MSDLTVPGEGETDMEGREYVSSLGSPLDLASGGESLPTGDVHLRLTSYSDVVGGNSTRVVEWLDADALSSNRHTGTTETTVRKSPPPQWDDLKENGGVLKLTEIRRSLRKTIEELMSFKDCEDLLRATSLAVAVQRGSTIFRSAEGDDDTYNLSKVTKQIDVFLSHNWSTPRYAKFLTLVYQYNYTMGLFVMLVASVAITIGSCYSVFPEVPDMTIEEALHPTIAIGCKFFSMPIFFLVVVLGRDFSKHIGMPGPSLFVDKCCIDQVDREVQRRGIRKLGAFLSKSKRMMVLYSDTYLQKLWTIYEMASFLAIHDLKYLEIVPVIQPKIVFCTLFFWWSYDVVTVFVRISQSFYYYMYVACGSGGFVCMIFLRGWERERAAIKDRVRNFSVESSSCANESDRPLVYHNIMSLMQGAQLVDTGSDLESALAAFNNLVRTGLPHAFNSMEGFRAYRMRDYILMGFAADGVKGLDWFATLWSRGLPARFIFTETMFHVFWMACWPVLVVGLEFLCSYNIALRGWREKVFVGAWFFLAVVVLAIFNQIVLHVDIDARESNASLGLLLGITAGLWFCCFAFCRDRKPGPPPDLHARCSDVSTGSREPRSRVSTWTDPESSTFVATTANLLDFGKREPDEVAVGIGAEMDFADDVGLFVVHVAEHTRL